MTDDGSHEGEKTLQVPSVQALQAVAFTVLVIHDQLVQNGYLEPGQVTERMRTYSFDDELVTKAVADMMQMLDQEPEIGKPRFDVVDGGKADND